jgi:tetratricopeptide (TPR) repeat protein
MKARFVVALLALAMLCALTLAQEDSAEDWFNKGQEQFRNHSYEDANEAYDKAIELNPQYGWAWGGKATALSILGRYNESLEAYDRAIETWPANDTERIHSFGYSRALPSTKPAGRKMPSKLLKRP